MIQPDNGAGSVVESGADPDSIIGGEDAENDLQEKEVCPQKPFSSQENPRVYVHKFLVAKLAKLGIRDESGPMGRAISEITDQALSLGIGWLPDAADIVSVTKSLDARLRELTVVQLSTMRLLVDLESAAEHKTLMATFKKMIFEEERKK
jgi:hypothetical protein